MAKQTINVGAVPNDTNADTVRDAFIKVNENFDEVYQAENISINTSVDGLDADNVQQMYDKFKIMTGVEYGNITPETGVIYYTLPPFS
jgi:hypothetical protein